MKPILNEYYPLKVWLLTIAIAAILLEVIFFVRNFDIISRVSLTNIVKEISMLAGLAAIYSLPALIISSACFGIFIKRKFKRNKARSLFIIVTLIEMYIIFYILLGNSVFTNLSESLIPNVYGACIILSAFLIRIDVSNKKTLSEKL